MSRDEFVSKCADLVEQHFPKGKTNMRGEAMVLVAMIASFLMEKGLIEDSAPNLLDKGEGAK